MGDFTYDDREDRKADRALVAKYFLTGIPAQEKMAELKELTDKDIKELADGIRELES